MKKFLNNIELLIIDGKAIESAKLILSEIKEFQESLPDKAYETKELKIQVIIIINRLIDLKQRELINAIDFKTVTQIKSVILKSLIEIREDLVNFIEFSDYLRQKEFKKEQANSLLFQESQGPPEAIIRPALFFTKRQDQTDLEHINPIFEIPSLMDCEGEIEKLKDLLPGDSLFEVLKARKKAINNLFDKYKLKGLSHVEGYHDIENELEKYSNKINKKIFQIEKNPQYLNLEDRAVLPQFFLVNRGKKSLINPLVVIKQNTRVRFYKKEGLSTMSLSIPERRSQDIKNLIHFIEQIDDDIESKGLLIERNKEDTNIAKNFIENLGSIGTQVNTFNFGSSTFMETPDYYRKAEVTFVENELRIEYNGSIKGGFFAKVKNTENYLVSTLSRGAESLLEYQFYLDNIEEPLLGKIKVVGI